MFKVGQKVVCINGKSWMHPKTREKIDGPKKGFVYEIKKIKEYSENTGLIFEQFDQELGYVSKYFKPYVDPQEEMNKVKEEILNKELILN